MNMQRRAGIYARISEIVEDREVGVGVGNQERQSRALCDRVSWDVIDVYIDDDTSAYSGKPRPDYNRMVGDIKSGRINAIAALHPDRLMRPDLRDLEDFIDLINAHDTAVHTVQAGDYDLSTASGRLMARQLGIIARYESEHRAERLVVKHAQLAADGAVTGGGYRPYGYERIYDRPERPHRIVTERIVPEEAAIIRECARRVLAGEALAAVCRDLNARGIPTSTGARWSNTTLARLLASARIAGAREHRPRSRAETRRPYIGEITKRNAWPAIISEEDSARLRSLLADPSRRKRPGPKGNNLLTRVLVCGRCKQSMNCRGHGQKDPRRAYYCDGQPGRNGCGKISIDAASADATVAEWVADALSSPGFRAALVRRDGPDDTTVLAAIADAERELEELATDMGRGLISRREWMAARAPIQARLDEAQGALSRADVTRTLEDVPDDLDGIRDYLLDEDIETTRRRAVILAAVEKITVAPAVKGRHRFDAERLDPDWRA